MDEDSRIARIGGRGARRRAVAGLSLIELLVAVTILAFSTAAMAQLWSLSRRITERSRDTAEYYAVARREMEKGRATGFVPLFFNSAYPTGNPVGVAPQITTQYNQDGDAPTVAKPAVYEAVSTFNRTPTGTEDEERQLGIQRIDVYLLPRTAGDVPAYSTVTFFCIGGV